MELMRKPLSPVVVLGLAATLSAGCGEGSDETVVVTSPSPGDVVSVPFELALDVNVPLGPPTFDLHHVHIWFDDATEDYVVVEQDVVQINNAPDGEHEMFVSLRYADHSATGAEASIRLVVSGGTTRSGG